MAQNSLHEKLVSVPPLHNPRKMLKIPANKTMHFPIKKDLNPVPPGLAANPLRIDLNKMAIFQS